MSSPSIWQVTAGACAVPVVALVWRLTGNYLYDHFVRKSTVLYEIEHIGEARPDHKRIKGTAVVCGGSIAGLWAARVASDHFEDVLVIEPEAWVGTELGTSNAFNAEGEPIEENQTPPRSRVMQYTNGLHAFQPMAYWALQKYFPNFDEEVKNANGRIQEFEVNGYTFGRKFLKIPKCKRDEVPRCFWLSREGYERILRRLVLGSSKRIRWMTGTATGLRTSPTNPSILTSVIVRLPDNTEQEVPAALVIDCTGRTQAGLKWLRRIASESVNAAELQKLVPSNAKPWDELEINYNCWQRANVFQFYIPPEARDSLSIPGGYENNVWPYTYMPIPGKEHLYYIINRIEGHRINLAFSGWGDPEIPESCDEIKDWMKRFEITHQKIPYWVYALTDELLQYKDQCKILTTKTQIQSWIFYESAPYVPSNFIAIGDAVMCVNPTFGQGCSKATMGALTLDGMLRKRPYADSASIPAGFGRKFFKVHRGKVESTWDGTKPSDYMFPTTTPVRGEKLSDEWLKGSLGNIAMELAGLDDEVDAELFKVKFFVAPPEALMKPRLLLKYAAFALRKQLGMVPPA